MCERGGHVWTGCGRVNEEDVWTWSGVIHFISSFWLDILMERYTQPNTASHDSVIRNSLDIIDN